MTILVIMMYFLIVGNVAGILFEIKLNDKNKIGKKLLLLTLSLFWPILFITNATNNIAKSMQEIEDNDDQSNN